MSKASQKPAAKAAPKAAGKTSGKAKAAAKPAAKAGAPAKPEPPKATKTSALGVHGNLVRELAAVLDETALTEIEYESGGLRIRVARGGGAVAAYAPAPAAAPATAAAIAASEKPAAPADPHHHPGAVKSPMVGVAYLLPEPGAAAFVKVGDSVNEGQTIALIEAMKTFNPVKAPRAGKVTAVLVENGSPVEYGEPLAIIE